MPSWVIEPVADPDDPRWQARRQWQRVVVRAPSAAFARVLAGTLDTPERALEQGHEHPHLGSGFKDEKLYRVVSSRDTGHPADGPDGILEAVERD